MSKRKAYHTNVNSCNLQQRSRPCQAHLCAKGFRPHNPITSKTYPTSRLRRPRTVNDNFLHPQPQSWVKARYALSPCFPNFNTTTHPQNSRLPFQSHLPPPFPKTLLSLSRQPAYLSHLAPRSQRRPQTAHPPPRRPLGRPNLQKAPPRNRLQIIPLRRLIPRQRNSP